MDAEKRKRLEAAGWRFGDYADFLGLTEEERQLVELRLAVSRAVRRRREAANLTQKELAAKLKTSQARVARIEAASSEVSLDRMFEGLYALGGTLRDLGAMPKRASARGKAKAEKKPAG